MIYAYSYIALLLFLIYLSIRIFLIGFKRAPGRIKGCNSIISLCFAVRYAALFILFIVQNMNYMYFMKYFTSLNFFAVPCAIALAMYIFMRIDGLNFKWFFLIMAGAAAFYAFIIMNFSTAIGIHNIFGYTVSFLEKGKVNVAYISVLSIGLIASVLGYGRSNSNFKGMLITMTGIMVLLCEIILTMAGWTITYNMLLGECVINLSLMMSLKTFRMKNAGRF